MMYLPLDGSPRSLLRSVQSFRPELAWGHLKQILHWSLMRMLHWPLRWPLRASKRLPGLAKSPIPVAASSWSGFLDAARAKPEKAAIRRPLWNASDLLSKKPTITTFSDPEETAPQPP